MTQPHSSLGLLAKRQRVEDTTSEDTSTVTQNLVRIVGDLVSVVTDTLHENRQLQQSLKQQETEKMELVQAKASELTEAQEQQKQYHFEGTHIKTIDGIKGPRHIAFATTGEMVVCEWGSNCVTVFSSSYRRLQSFGNTGSEESRLINPRGVAISSDNTVFVAAEDCVKKFTLEGQFIASVGSEGSGRLQFDEPWAIAYNSTNNRVYVCDTYNHRITILNHDLTFHGSFGSKGSEAGQFNNPDGISVDRKGNVLVADELNNRIQVFDASGHYLSSITHTTPGQQLKRPVSVSVGPDDCVYVVENGSARVSVFDENGKYIKSFGKRGNKDGEFNSPRAIAVSADGYVYVSDTGNNQLQIFK